MLDIKLEMEEAGIGAEDFPGGAGGAGLTGFGGCGFFGTTSGGATGTFAESRIWSSMYSKCMKSLFFE
jgi:hypothetical protein